MQGFFSVEKRTRLREIGQHNCIFNVNYILALQLYYILALQLYYILALQLYYILALQLYI